MHRKLSMNSGAKCWGNFQIEGVSQMPLTLPSMGHSSAVHGGLWTIDARCDIRGVAVFHHAGRPPRITTPSPLFMPIAIALPVSPSAQ